METSASYVSEPQQKALEGASTEFRTSGMTFVARFQQPRRLNLFSAYVIAATLIWILLSCRSWNSVSQTRFEQTPTVHLVLTTTSSNKHTWTNNLTLKNYKVIPYIVDNKTALYHTPANEGNEAMGYLAYLYEFYDHLPDISIFLHGQDLAWHGDGALNYSTATTLNLLDLDEVKRRKFMNLRTNWQNGCPNWINTSITVNSSSYEPETKPEEAYMREAFEALFPGDDVPEILAAPCCSQLAVTRDTIRGVPREVFRNAMEWLQNGRFHSSISGRIWEHLWQWMFLKKAVDCPDESVALCSGYHVCFEKKEWEDWKVLEKMRLELLEELKEPLEPPEESDTGNVQGEIAEAEWRIKASERTAELALRIKTLEKTIEPWRQKAIWRGESEKRRREIIGG
ncbi:hypothetical protein VTL71DRAFT_9640 [Oculimacula yallundae]|uniref:Uncharacterized protein n=1 Tax=Oculimacula yallundae TaxID=86028 RepID=A0ABR4BRF9_9HELO